ncbi:MAG: hypothetical protein M1827_007412 [Pycnora praestabilis]|nr:MAG: hypothetical protein M1827_007412 [Pycnora praestabilis]
MAVFKICQELGFSKDSAKRPMKMLTSATHEWRRRYQTPNGDAGTTLCTISSPDLIEMARKYLDDGDDKLQEPGHHFWPTTSCDRLEYRRDREKILSLLTRLFHAQNCNERNHAARPEPLGKPKKIASTTQPQEKVEGRPRSSQSLFLSPPTSPKQNIIQVPTPKMIPDYFTEKKPKITSNGFARSVETPMPNTASSFIEKQETLMRNEQASSSEDEHPTLEDVFKEYGSTTPSKAIRNPTVHFDAPSPSSGRSETKHSRNRNEPEETGAGQENNNDIVNKIRKDPESAASTSVGVSIERSSKRLKSVHISESLEEGIVNPAVGSEILMSTEAPEIQEKSALKTPTEKTAYSDAVGRAMSMPVLDQIHKAEVCLPSSKKSVIAGRSLLFHAGIIRSNQIRSRTGEGCASRTSNDHQDGHEHREHQIAATNGTSVVSLDESVGRKSPVVVKLWVLRTHTPRKAWKRWIEGSIRSHDASSMFRAVLPLTEICNVQALDVTFMTAEQEWDFTIPQNGDAEFEDMKKHIREKMAEAIARNGNSSKDFEIFLEPIGSESQNPLVIAANGTEVMPDW